MKLILILFTFMAYGLEDKGNGGTGDEARLASLNRTLLADFG